MFPGFPGHLVVVPHPHLPGHPSTDLQDGAGQLGQAPVPAAEPPHAPVLQAQRQHGQDPPLRVQVQPRRLVRALPALQESQSALLYGLLGELIVQIRVDRVLLTFYTLTTKT